jgi:hypothetical protein
MGCIQSSAYTTGTILGTYSGVNALDECNNYCGVCCIPGCESDFAQVNDETNNCYYPEITWNAGLMYDCNNYAGNPEYPFPNSLKKRCPSFGGYPNATGYSVAGWCPANFSGGYFENNYDCSSSRADYELSQTASPFFDNNYSIDSYDILAPYYADPCEGNYPCTKTGPEITQSMMLTQKNARLEIYNSDTAEILGGERDPYANTLFNWDNLLPFFLESCMITCPDYTLQNDLFYFPGSYQNYFYFDYNTTDPVPVCDMSGPVIPSGTAKDVVAIFRFAFSSTYSVTFDYQPESSPGANDGYAYASKKEWVHSRKHDTHLYVCDSNAGTMTDVSSSGCLNRPMTFYYPWYLDTPSPASYYYCGGDVGYPGWIIGVNRGSYYIPYNPGPTTNAIVGTVQQGAPATVYGVEVAGPNGGGPYDKIITQSFSGPLGNSTITPIPLPAFLPLPNIAGSVNVNYICNDTIGQSGCADQLSSVWHSGQDCTTFDCNV